MSMCVTTLNEKHLYHAMLTKALNKEERETWDLSK